MMAQLSLFYADLSNALDAEPVATAGEALALLRRFGPAWAGDAEVREHLAGRMVDEGRGELIVSALLN